jgi:acetyltransferase-like isoleucine patch superfamily enzyme
MWLLVERLLRWSINPRLRARLLRLVGADIGSGVRIYESSFFNLSQGFRNLTIAPDAHVGTACLIDLHGPVRVGRGAVISPGVTLLTHADPGSEHGSPLADIHPPSTAPIDIGAFAWVGARSLILPGVSIGSRAIVAAGAVVIHDVPDGETWGGVPARRLNTG